MVNLPYRGPLTSDLITFALKDKAVLTVNGIYHWIKENFPYFAQDDRCGVWLNLTRNLNRPYLEAVKSKSHESDLVTCPRGNKPHVLDMTREISQISVYVFLGKNILINLN